jgi:hypothetical protein
VGGGAHAPNDFKVSCFDGTPGYYFWANRSSSPTLYAFFTPDGTQFIWGEPTEIASNADAEKMQPSRNLRDRMMRVASAVAAPFDWIRVDFYVDDEMLWFGELTLYGAGGLYTVDAENNDRFGARWRLPDLNAPDLREAEWRALLQGTPKGTLQE